MLGRFKSAVYNAIGGLEEENVVTGIRQPGPTPRYITLLLTLYSTYQQLGNIILSTLSSMFLIFYEIVNLNFILDVLDV